VSDCSYGESGGNRRRYRNLYVETEEGSVLERLGIGEQTSLHAFPCPECGVTKLYTDL